MFCAFDQVTWLVFQAVLAPLALPCSLSPAAHSRLLPFPPWPRGMTPRIKLGLCLLWPHKSEFICGEMSTSKLTIQRPLTSSVQCHTPGLWGDLCSCRHSELWQAMSHDSACVTYTTKAVFARLLQVPRNNTGLTLCRFWNKWTVTGFLYNCYINPEHSWEKLEEARPGIPDCQKNRSAESQCNPQRGTQLSWEKKPQ